MIEQVCNGISWFIWITSAIIGGLIGGSFASWIGAIAGLVGGPAILLLLLELTRLIIGC